MGFLNCRRSADLDLESEREGTVRQLRSLFQRFRPLLTDRPAHPALTRPLRRMDPALPLRRTDPLHLTLRLPRATDRPRRALRATDRLHRAAPAVTARLPHLEATHRLPLPEATHRPPLPEATHRLPLPEATPHPRLPEATDLHPVPVDRTDRVLPA